MGNQSIFKHGGDKPIQTDFTTFKPKSISQTVSQVQLQSHLQNLNRKQQSITKYRYHQDFDRIANQRNSYVANVQQTFENVILFSSVVCIFITKKYIDHLYKSQSNLSLFKRYYFPITIATIAGTSLYLYASQIGHVVNDRFFRQIGPEEKTYRALDEHMDLYRYVDDIKYRFDYRRAAILKSRQKYHQDFLANIQKQIIQQNNPTNIQINLNTNKSNSL